MPAKSPRQRRKLRTREAILDAAANLVAEEGPEELSMREIAQRIDYSPAGLYEYFASKDAIIDAICGQANERLLHHLRGVPADLPPDEQVVELGLAYIRFARQTPHLFNMMFNRRRAAIDHAPAREELADDDSMSVLYDALARGVTEGVFELTPPLEIFDLTYSLWAVVHGAASLQTSYLSEVSYDFEAIDRRTIDMVVRAICKPA
jgi:AcrR family transcriptional regulator